MSLPVPGQVATRLITRTAGARVLGHVVRAWARAAASLWPADRGVAELRWGAATLWSMALLGALATAIDPADGGFLRLIGVALPAAIVVGVVAWTPIAPRVGRSSALRYLIGPFVLAVAFVGAGLADVETLALPSAAPFIVLAMAFAAMTPGFPIAAALLAGITAGTLVAHWESSAAGALTGQLSDEFVVGAVVTLVASAGMAGVLRVATRAEARATMLARQRRERLDALETLSTITARFDGSQPVPAVMQGVIDDIAREFEITLASIYLPITPERPERLTMVGVAGYPHPFHEIDVGVGIIGRAAATRQTQFVADVTVDPDYRAARADVTSEVAAPVVHGNELLGVLNFEGTADRPIGPAQVALAEMVVHTLAAALRSARLDDERRHRLHAIERVLAVSRSLVADLDRGRIVASIADVVADLLRADVVALFSRGADRMYRLEATVGLQESAIGTEAPDLDGMIDQCVSGRSRCEGTIDVASWPAGLAGERSGPARQAAMTLPIAVGADVVAVLVVTRAGAERGYTEVERRIADLLTAQIAIALQNADLHARVAESALRDPLTGLLNRRFFDEAVETAHANARRAGSELSLIVLDLDHFSAVNNEHGHAVGDTVLRRVALAIKRSVRDGDVVVRYGGEEFVVIAPATDGEGAVTAAERIRAAVAEATATPVDGRLIPLTISAGVASLVDERDGRSLFRAADSALLAAKRGGRDRVSRI
jgi:diguanylate cyclase (GGDEF)-like protein